MPTSRSPLKILSDLYERSRKVILDEIISETHPEKEIDISAAYRRSKMLLGSYVTLDWEHRNNIRDVITSIQKYASDKSSR